MLLQLRWTARWTAVALDAALDRLWWTLQMGRLGPEKVLSLAIDAAADAVADSVEEEAVRREAYLQRLLQQLQHQLQQQQLQQLQQQQQKRTAFGADQLSERSTADQWNLADLRSPRSPRGRRMVARCMALLLLFLVGYRLFHFWLFGILFLPKNSWLWLGSGGLEAAVRHAPPGTHEPFSPEAAAHAALHSVWTLTGSDSGSDSGSSSGSSSGSGSDRAPSRLDGRWPGGGSSSDLLSWPSWLGASRSHHGTAAAATAGDTWTLQQSRPGIGSAQWCLTGLGAAQRRRDGPETEQWLDALVNSLWAEPRWKRAPLRVISFADTSFAARRAAFLRELQASRAFEFQARIWGPEDLQPLWNHNRDWYTANKHRGGGYWVWKPWILNQTLHESLPQSEGELLVYLDVGVQYNAGWAAERRLVQYLHWACRYNLVSFLMPLPSIQWTVREIFEHFQVGEEQYRHWRQHVAGILVLKNTAYTRRLIADWIQAWYDNPNLFSDWYGREANAGSSPAPRQRQHPEFRENRHDQAVFSTLCHLHGCFWIDDETVPPASPSGDTEPDWTRIANSPFRAKRLH